MKQGFLRIFDKLTSKKLDFRVRLFNMLALSGMSVSFIASVWCAFRGSEPVNIMFNLLAGFIAVGLLVFVTRSGKYQLGYMVTIIVVFLFIFPILFFISGGYHGGMPSFFIFAIIFTVFMLQGKKMFVMTAIEAFFYVGICVFAYRFPESTAAVETEANAVTDVIINFMGVSSALGIAIYAQLKMYNEQQRLLAEQNAALEQINQLKTEFLGNVSHELKTPLTVMSGYAQFSQRNLEDKPDMAEVSDRMRLITAEADRLALMVTQILDMTRIEEGLMDITPQRTSIVEIIQSTLSTYFPIMNKNNNQLRFRQEGSPSLVNADPARVTQVLVNLIANAVRHTRDGEITVLTVAKPGYAEISVTDTGEGISSDMLPHIFERFYTKTQTGGGKETGTGLGLFICKHIVEAHGGEIMVRSEPGKGTTVTFTLLSAV